MRAKIDSEGNILIPNSKKRKDRGERNTYHTPTRGGTSRNSFTASIIIGTLIAAGLWFGLHCWSDYQEKRLREAATITRHHMKDADTLKPHYHECRYFYNKADQILRCVSELWFCTKCADTYCSKHSPDVRREMYIWIRKCEEFIAGINLDDNDMNTDDKCFIYHGCQKICQAHKLLNRDNFQRLNNRSESTRWNFVLSKLSALTRKCNSIIQEIEKPLNED